MEINAPGNFIHDFIDEDLAAGVYDHVHTRFPPEPNGYLHIGSAKAILINYVAAKKYGGTFNLRYDDTNPVKEDEEYVRAIEHDLVWLGAVPDGGIFYGSDYFDLCYEYALDLIREGKAFVCDLSAEQIREYRGTLTEPGRESPFRNRSIEENLDLFVRMKDGEFPDGTRTLRAKIDMSSPNINMRDPAIYRIIHAHHHRQGDKWCIYPLYDYAHPIQDAIEGITHSLCSIEFENHRPLYNWVRDNVKNPNKPRQIEFARLGVTYTVMSKRWLRKLVEEGHVAGWDDPRMPTLCGLRRRGYSPAAIRSFCERIGVAKSDSTVDYGFLEHCVRDELNGVAVRAMAVLDPLKLVITNYPEGKRERFEIEVNPEQPELGMREAGFSREVWIEREDFMENPPGKYHRLSVGREVRLKGAYVVRCTGFKKDENGEIIEVYAECDETSRGGNPADGRRIKGTIHWVDAGDCSEAEVRLYQTLFKEPMPDPACGLSEALNPESLVVMKNAKVERYLDGAKPGDRFQFLRMGYFAVDSDSTDKKPVFNRTVTLKDSWAKLLK